MSLATDLPRYAEDRPEAAPESRKGGDNELDLERLVWDPEYRAAMRPLLSRAG